MFISDDDFVKRLEFKAMWLRVVGPPKEIPKIKFIEDLNLDH